MFPGQRGHHDSNPPIDVLDRRRQTRITKLGPFMAGNIELAGRRLLHSAGKAHGQLRVVADLYKQRPAGENLIIIDFTEVDTQADFEFPSGGVSLIDHYPTRLIVKRGIKEPIISRGETGTGLARIALEGSTITLKCLQRRTAVEKTVITVTDHFVLRADGEIFVTP